MKLNKTNMHDNLKHINTWFLLNVVLYAAFQWGRASWKRCVVSCSDVKPLKILGIT